MFDLTTNVITPFSLFLFAITIAATIWQSGTASPPTMKQLVRSAMGTFCVAVSCASTTVFFGTVRFALSADETVSPSPGLTADGDVDVASTAAETNLSTTDREAVNPTSDPRLAPPNPPVPDLTIEPTDVGEREQVVEDPRQSLVNPPVPPKGSPIDCHGNTVVSTELDEAVIAHMPLAKADPLWVPVQINGRNSGRITVGPFLSDVECGDALDDELSKRTAQYIDQQLGRRNATQFVRFDVDFIRENLLVGDVEDQLVRTSFGPMHQMTANLQFDDSFTESVQSRWLAAQREARLMQTGVGSAAVFLLLATLLGYLKLDTATRGNCTGRLKLATGTVILALAVSGALVARWIPWI